MICGAGCLKLHPIWLEHMCDSCHRIQVCKRHNIQRDLKHGQYRKLKIYQKLRVDKLKVGPYALYFS